VIKSSPALLAPFANYHSIVSLALASHTAKFGRDGKYYFFHQSIDVYNLNTSDIIVKSNKKNLKAICFMNFLLF
jgi:hypothetical protein